VRIFRLLLLSVIILFLIVTAISLLLPSHVRISRAANIHANADDIWLLVDDLHSWKEWNPFFSQVPASEIQFIDAKDDKPAAMKLEGTLIQLKEKKPDERIYVMDTKGKKSVINGWKFISNSVGDSSTLQWYIDFNLRWYPWEKFASLLFEKSYGARIEEGLRNIKKTVEKSRTSFYQNSSGRLFVDLSHFYKIQIIIL
jgi:hypothetical protein